LKPSANKSRKIILFPLGGIEESIVHSAAAFLENLHHFPFKCVVTNRRPIPIGTLDNQRQQYNCKQILKYYIKCCPDNCFRLIGITDVDVYVPVLKYVFGLAQLKGNCAIISTHRLRPEFYCKPSNKWLFQQRLYKTLLHELGHTVGLTHCSNRRCVMFSSTRIEDTDKKETSFCGTCRELFSWYLNGI